MKVASIIMPYANEGDIDAGIRAVRDLALAHWGGYTEQPVKGAWRDPDTGIVHYDHAIRFDIGGVGDNEVELLANVARRGGALAKQIAVAFITPSGDMQIANV